jgi:hypothetical protein
MTLKLSKLLSFFMTFNPQFSNGVITMSVVDFATGKAPELEGGAWYNKVEAKQILDAVTPGDVSISLDDGAFIWSIRPDLDQRLEVLRLKNVDEQLGYTLDEVDDDYSRQDKWYDFEESQASIHDRLQLKFGDPNILRPYGLDSANRLWQKDSNAINRAIQRKRDLEEQGG